MIKVEFKISAESWEPAGASCWVSTTWETSIEFLAPSFSPTPHHLPLQSFWGDELADERACTLSLCLSLCVSLSPQINMCKCSRKAILQMLVRQPVSFSCGPKLKIFKFSYV